MKALDLELKCPKCGNLGIHALEPGKVSKNKEQQVKCNYYKCGSSFYRTHPEVILLALTEKVSELEKSVNILLSWKENLIHDLQSINEDIVELQKRKL